LTEYSRNPRVSSKVYREPLRVGTVARICQVTRKTIFNWIKHGTLKSFTTHGGHNRIWPRDLRAFLDRAGMDIEFKFDETRGTRFLIVNDNPSHKQLMQKSFSDRFPSASVAATQCHFEALLLVGEQKPQVVAWDLNMPKLDRAQIIDFLTKRNMNNSIHVTLCHDNSPEKLKWCAYAGIRPEVTTGIGITQMLNSLQELLADKSLQPNYNIPQPIEQAPPYLIQKD